MQLSGLTGLRIKIQLVIKTPIYFSCVTFFSVNFLSHGYLFSENHPEEKEAVSLNMWLFIIV